ncbi:hypothetical protein M917_2387 [Psychrobacter aquaticus CMS 56]|uniref:Uncharacterized protein n=1 Tax=Psychrobacter aquaticus CMS 56 TaxID=1354303 RepID=U4T4G4_9GAMM|nr:hypothetical protein M917_2387 [Psychrobacter aquaticus CMS 56]
MSSLYDAFAHSQHVHRAKILLSITWSIDLICLKAVLAR